MSHDPNSAGATLGTAKAQYQELVVSNGMIGWGTSSNGELPNRDVPINTSASLA
jgi:hypothetical protein